METTNLYFSTSDKEAFILEKAALEQEVDEKFRQRNAANSEKTDYDGVCAISGLDEILRVNENRIALIDMCLKLGVFTDEPGDIVMPNDTVTVSAVGLEGNTSSIPGLYSYKIVLGDAFGLNGKNEKGAKKISATDLLSRNLLGKSKWDGFSYYIPREIRLNGRKIVDHVDTVSGTIISIARSVEEKKVAEAPTNADGHSSLILK